MRIEKPPGEFQLLDTGVEERTSDEPEIVTDKQDLARDYLKLILSEQETYATSTLLEGVWHVRVEDAPGKYCLLNTGIKEGDKTTLDALEADGRIESLVYDSFVRRRVQYLETDDGVWLTEGIAVREEPSSSYPDGRYCLLEDLRKTEPTIDIVEMDNDTPVYWRRFGQWKPVKYHDWFEEEYVYLKSTWTIDDVTIHFVW